MPLLETNGFTFLITEKSNIVVYSTGRWSKGRDREKQLRKVHRDRKGCRQKRATCANTQLSSRLKQTISWKAIFYNRISIAHSVKMLPSLSLKSWNTYSLNIFPKIE
ncbi:hypothetical protein Y032_0004g2196 [Ancylostoma ceylanicum]|uniref:Uncharacterized protein n=1 Tax=Ancylostoma ceylanicum TaxID=53326 RepID=A0A016VWY5_9BILA|nr:hypothetical protein Y032_0004g2196 [Ancylostoma ceylanicum]